MNMDNEHEQPSHQIVAILFWHLSNQKALCLQIVVTDTVRVIKQNWIIWVRQNYFNILASRLLTGTQECNNDNQILLKMTKPYFVTRPNIAVHRLQVYCTHHLCSFPRPCTSWACSTDTGSGWFSGCYTAGSWCMVGSWSFVGWTDGRIPEIKRYALIILSCIGLHPYIELMWFLNCTPIFVWCTL